MCFESTSGPPVILRFKHPEWDLSWKRFVHPAERGRHSCQITKGCVEGCWCLGWVAVDVDSCEKLWWVVSIVPLTMGCGCIVIWSVFCVWRCNLIDFHSASRMGGEDAPLGYYIQPLSGTGRFSYKHWLKGWKWQPGKDPTTLSLWKTNSNEIKLHYVYSVYL